MRRKGKQLRFRVNLLYFLADPIIATVTNDHLVGVPALLLSQCLERLQYAAAILSTDQSDQNGKCRWLQLFIKFGHLIPLSFHSWPMRNSPLRALPFSPSQRSLPPMDWLINVPADQANSDPAARGICLKIPASVRLCFCCFGGPTAS